MNHFNKRRILGQFSSARVRVWLEHFTSCQIYSLVLLQFAMFWVFFIIGVCFGNVSSYGVGLFGQVIVLG